MARLKGKMETMVKNMKTIIENGGEVKVFNCKHKDNIIKRLNDMGVGNVKIREMEKTKILTPIYGFNGMEEYIVGYGGGGKDVVGTVFYK